MKRKYFFGYLFVRARRELALMVMAMGIGFCVLEYSRAINSTSATAYQGSASFQRALANLTDAFSAAQRIVSGFNVEHQLAAPAVQPPRFPTVIQSKSDFAVIDEALTRADQDAQKMKQSILIRFETLVNGIEEKLRVYAAGVEGATSSPVLTINPGAASRPSLSFGSESDGSLFSSKLGSGDATRRSLDLNAHKEFLKVLGTKAENPENRANLTEAVAQLEALGKLLPEKSQASTETAPGSGAPADPRTDEARKVLPSERVATHLEQLRADVRQILLTSWTLDEALGQAFDLTAVEREKCRVATLAQKGIWLSTISRILVAMLVAILASFVILVCADLVKTFLDTASHTGVVADAINAMRGSTIIAKNQLRQSWPASGNDIN